MHINHEIAEMKKRMFTDDLLHTIFEAYQQETEADGFGTSAQEYRKGKATLLSLLNEPQKEILAQAEALCRENLKYALEFGFSQGTYAGFQQFFTDSTPERPFHTYIVEQLLTMPNMKRHPGYYENRTRFNQVFDQVGKALDAEQKESLVAVESAWDECLYGFLRHSFYLGYRYALNGIDADKKLGNSTQLLGKVLLTEHELGFTSTCEGRERRCRRPAE